MFPRALWRVWTDSNPHLQVRCTIYTYRTIWFYCPIENANYFRQNLKFTITSGSRDSDPMRLDGLQPTWANQLLNEPIKNRMICLFQIKVCFLLIAEIILYLAVGVDLNTTSSYYSVGRLPINLLNNFSYCLLL
jgi:hypothetical protein